MLCSPSGYVASFLLLAGAMALPVALSASMSFFDDEISAWWCFRATWRCTPAEATGLWSTILFYMAIVVVTAIHMVMQTGNPNDDDATQWQLKSAAAGSGDEVQLLCLLMLYFFGFVAGCLIWALGGVRWVHPVQVWQIQLVGSAGLVVCTCLFVAVHVSMGESWSPEADLKAPPKLITHGVFRWARHPMYAVFLWATVCTSVATLNWLVTLCVGSVLMTLRRIETEERILLSLFGERYAEYRRHVSALGPPWGCLGFDRGEIIAPHSAEYDRCNDSVSWAPPARGPHT